MNMDLYIWKSNGIYLYFTKINKSTQNSKLIKVIIKYINNLNNRIQHEIYLTNYFSNKCLLSYVKFVSTIGQYVDITFRTDCTPTCVIPTPSHPAETTRALVSTAQPWNIERRKNNYCIFSVLN